MVDDFLYYLYCVDMPKKALQIGLRNYSHNPWDSYAALQILHLWEDFGIIGLSVRRNKTKLAVYRKLQYE